MLTEPKQFAPREGSFKEVSRKVVRIGVVLALIACLAGIFISQYSSRGTEKENINVLPYMLPLFALAISFGMSKGLKRQKAAFESYRLTIEPNSIYRDMEGLAPIQLYHSEVTSIAKTKEGGLIIKGKEKGDLIRVPAQIEDSEALESLLSQIRPIETGGKQSQNQVKTILMTIGVLALMVLTYVSKNAYLVTVAGISVIAFLIWAYVTTQKNPEVDQKTKKGMTMVFLVVFSVLMKVLSVWVQP